MRQGRWILTRTNKSCIKLINRKLHQTEACFFITRPLSEYGVKAPLCFEGRVGVVTGAAAGNFFYTRWRLVSAWNIRA